ncbi:MAG: alpha/beta hydrolase [Cryobacterium sp.]|nr:alpha/beta hydrolase [Oligoflexia bacterium]
MAGESTANARNGYFRTFDGTKLFYSVEGEGKALIFCYGLVCSSLHWTYQIEHFRKSHQAVWMDYRGHQNSEIPADYASLTLENLAKDLKLLLDELKIKDAVFLGHSMGVNVVLEFYRLFPERVAGMVLANGTADRPLETLLHSNALIPGFRALEILSEKSPKLLKKLWSLQKGNSLVQRGMSLLGFNPHLTAQEDVALYVDQIADMDPKVFLTLIRNYDRYDGSSWLHTVKAPTQILAGEDDLVIPLAQQELLHQLIPDSRFEVIRHGSHCPQMDLPDLVNSKIDEFLLKIGY